MANKLKHPSRLCCFLSVLLLLKLKETPENVRIPPTSQRPPPGVMPFPLQHLPNLSSTHPSMFKHADKFFIAKKPLLLYLFFFKQSLTSILQWEKIQHSQPLHSLPEELFTMLSVKLLVQNIPIVSACLIKFFCVALTSALQPTEEKLLHTYPQYSLFSLVVQLTTG